jgi:hypothetical protein
MPLNEVSLFRLVLCLRNFLRLEDVGLLAPQQGEAIKTLLKNELILSRLKANI